MNNLEKCPICLQHEERIKALEQKNGTEMKKMEELNSEIKELKSFISKNITKDRIS